MTMIERVARALCGHDPDKYWQLFVPGAQAAIKAMREPTEEMIFAPDMSSLDARDQSTAEIWQAMIDAALKEGG